MIARPSISLEWTELLQLGLLLPGTAPLTQACRLAGGSNRNGQSYAVNGMRPESNQFLAGRRENYNSVNAGFVLKLPRRHFGISDFDQHGLRRVRPQRRLQHQHRNAFGIESRSRRCLRVPAERCCGCPAISFDQRGTVEAKQFGGTLGGPSSVTDISVWLLRRVFATGRGETQLTTVPTADQRQGNFGASAPVMYRCSDLCADPNGSQLVNVFANPPQPLPFNQLPPGSINSISQNLLSFYPMPQSA